MRIYIKNEDKFTVEKSQPGSGGEAGCSGQRQNDDR